MTAATADQPLRLPRRRVLGITLATFVAAVVILFAAVLPAEYNRDPLGLGRLTGTAGLWAPSEQEIAAGSGTARAQRSETVPFREDVVDIALQSGQFGGDVEYKVGMKEGSTLVYSWTTPDLTPEEGEDFFSELHGHTVEAGKTMTVVNYRKDFGGADAGAITAAVDGVHGWYAKNRADHPMTMRLRLAGFYTLIPPGEVGNEGRILPVAPPPAPAAR